jgi:hypothetical protein
MNPFLHRIFIWFLLIVCFCFSLGCVYLCFHLSCTFDGWISILDFVLQGFFLFFSSKRTSFNFHKNMKYFYLTFNDKNI